MQVNKCPFLHRMIPRTSPTKRISFFIIFLCWMDYWFTYKDTLIQFINHFFSRHKFIEDSQATIFIVVLCTLNIWKISGRYLISRPSLWLMCVDVQVSPQKKIKIKIKKTVFSLLGIEPLLLYFKSFFLEEIYFYLNYFLCFQIFIICQYKK